MTKVDTGKTSEEERLLQENLQLKIENRTYQDLQNLQNEAYFRQQLLMTLQSLNESLNILNEKQERQAIAMEKLASTPSQSDEEVEK